MRSQIEVAKELAQYHRAQDLKTTTIKFFPLNGEGAIGLLEVSDAVPTVGEILPYFFPADPEEQIDYPSTVILVSPKEWQSVQRGQLALPQGWNLQDAIEI